MKIFFGSESALPAFRQKFVIYGRRAAIVGDI
jgi:hypothetical protein